MEKEISENKNASWIIDSMTKIDKEKVHYGFYCSVCHNRIFDITDESQIPEVCPECGSDMSIN